MNKLTTVYVSIKVEDELPDIMESVVTISNNNKYSVHQRVDSEVYKDDLQTLTEFHDKYGFLNFGCDEKFVEHWLKPTEGYFFTEEQLKQVLSDAFQAAREFNSLDGPVDIDVVLPMGGDISDLQAIWVNADNYIHNFLNK